jgi:hypothetical protein
MPGHGALGVTAGDRAPLNQEPHRGYNVLLSSYYASLHGKDQTFEQGPGRLAACHPRREGLGPGQELAVVSTDDGVLLRPLKPFKDTTLDDVVGCLKYKGKPKSLEEMDAAVLAEAKRHK